MELFKKLRTGVFIIYALWIAIGAVLAAFGKCTILIATLPLWGLICLVFFVILGICLFTLIGDWMKAKNPPSCENCLWGTGRALIGHCLGEKEGCKYGCVCQRYVRKTE